jgi:GTPase SAR1 family protein
VSYDDAERMADCFNSPYIETSSKDSISSDNNVDTVFELVLTQLFKKEKKIRDESKSILIKKYERV